MQKARCDKCTFWSDEEYSQEDRRGVSFHKDERVGECKRFPPFWMSVNCDYRPDGFSFPNTSSGNWCGEFKQK